MIGPKRETIFNCDQCGVCMRQALWDYQRDLLDEARFASGEASRSTRFPIRAMFRKAAAETMHLERVVRYTLLKFRASRCTGRGGCGTVYKL